MLETCLQLLLYVDEIKITSGFQKMEERVHCNVLNDHPAVEPRADKLLHPIVRLLYFFLELFPTASEHRKVHLLSSIKLGLQQLHEFIFERYFEGVEMLEVDEMGLKLLDVGSNAAEEAHPNRVQLKPPHKLGLDFTPVGALGDLNVLFRFEFRY